VTLKLLSGTFLAEPNEATTGKLYSVVSINISCSAGIAA
jgi:hypothetical protein